MNLNELAVRVIAALLVKRGLGRTGADDRVGRLAKNCPVASRGDNDGIGRKGANFHAAQIHGADAAADAASIEHRGEELPMLILLDLAFGFVAPDLFVERIEKLLAGGCAGERGAVI